ncbi:MAG: hypothetical protein NTX57_19875, partial [Armatimonadetes bacterium]|nr:hypothetical protein [Armatimonadota bacterium]
MIAFSLLAPATLRQSQTAFIDFANGKGELPKILLRIPVPHSTIEYEGSSHHVEGNDFVSLSLTLRRIEIFSPSLLILKSARFSRAVSYPKDQILS